jgi:tetratricopeptide (TPR) repeat protein
MRERLIIILLWLFPYTMLGEETGAHVLLAVLTLFFLLTKKDERLTVNRGFLFLLLSMSVLSLISVFFSVNPIRSLYGVSLAGTALLSYLAFRKEEQDQFIRYSVYSITLLALFSIIYQGIFRGMRIYGNFGYANTYALVLFIGLVFTERLKDKKLDFFIKLILITALLYTGDRTMLFCLIVWVMYRGVRSKSLDLVVSLVTSLIFYFLCVKLGSVSIILSPILVFLMYFLYMLLIRINKIVLIVVMVSLCLGLSTLSTNTVDRIKNISFQTPSLVERVISYEDVIHQVPSNLLGKGANSYEYSQYPIKSAFYESKYVHNSFLQYLYDYGLAGVLLFSGLIFYGFIQIITSRNPNKELYSIIYVVIVLHGLLNFDMVYPTLWMVLVGLVTFCSEKREFFMRVRSYRMVFGLLGSCSLLLAFHEGTMKADQWPIMGGQPFSGLLTIQSHLRIPDDRIYFIKAGLEKNQFDHTQNSTYLVQARKDLSTAQKLNPVDPRIKWNLAFILQEEKNYKAAGELWKQVLVEEKYNPEVYQIYAQYLEATGKTNTEIMNMAELRNSYDQSKKALNPKAKYLPKQLKGSLEETLSN